MDNIKNNIVGAWGRVHLDLKSKLPGHAIHAWFDPIVPVSFIENVFVLEVPNQFFLEWIESHYKEEIIESIKNTFNASIGYRFSIKKEIVNEIPDVLTNKNLRKDKIKKFNNLNSKYTFSNFIVGGNNEFAKTAAEDPDPDCNRIPLLASRSKLDDI